jgi:hypothetical protein
MRNSVRESSGQIQDVEEERTVDSVPPDGLPVPSTGRTQDTEDHGGSRTDMPRPARGETAYIVYDTESVPDGALLSRVLYPQDDLGPEAALARYRKEHAREGEERLFIPVAFQVPVAVGVARVAEDLSILELKSLDAPGFDPRSLVAQFWRGVEYYNRSVLVDFNGRGFDLPLLTLAAFRFGVECPRYFNDPDRFGFRYRFTSRHIDLMEWITEYGAFRVTGGLNLLAKMLGKPGKMGTSGADVESLYSQGKVEEINDYCLHDVLDTYFVFLRTRVLTGELPLAREQELVARTREWLEGRAASEPALAKYLESFGAWVGEPFR